MVVTGAGRTDAGVHAKEMYAHFDIGETVEVAKLVHRMNSFLPDDIAIDTIFQVNDDAHARFDAIERTYEYWVVQEKNPFYKDSAHFVWSPLNLENMNKAASIITEYDDFECFSKSNTDVKTFVCDVRSAHWEKRNDKLVFTITADRFLRNMVRAVVGTLLDVGLGKTDPEYVRSIIESKDRAKAGVSVPAKGLYLTKVTYPETIYV